jgi:putative aldouronate transport system substrate-binding protein
MSKTTRLVVLIAAGLLLAGSLFAQSELKIHFRYNNQYTITSKSSKAILPVFAYAAQKTGVKLVDVANPVATNDGQEFQLQATNQFSAADIYGGSGLAQYFYSFGRDGAFIDLIPYLNAGKLPNFKAFLVAHPDVRAALITPDKKLFYFPYVPDGGVARTYWIRTDWLKKLGLAIPTTTEELEAVLTAFHDKDPNGNGKKDEIPYFNDHHQEAFRLANLWGARVFGNDDYGVRVVADQVGGKMYHAWLDPRFKNAVVQLARWYKLGLIDQEIFVRKDNTARKELLTGTNVGGMTNEWVASTGGFNFDPVLLKAVPDFKFEVIPPVAAAGMQPFAEHARILVKPDGWAISSASKNIDAALRYCDWFWSVEGRNTINFGVEGQTWTKGSDGKPVFTKASLAWASASAGMNRALWDNQGAQMSIGYWQDYNYEAPWTLAPSMKGVLMYRDAKKVTYAYQTPVMTYTKAEQELVTSVNDQVNQYLEEEITKMIVGRANIDTEWPIYVKHAIDLGAQKIVDAYQSAYTRYLANRK